MSCRAHQLALWAGCLLLLLAAALLVKSESAASSGLSGQRLRVQEALASSAPCLTCHSAVSGASKVVLDAHLAHAPLEAAAEPVAVSTSLSPAQTSTEIENAHVRAKWLEVGARLLAVDAQDLDQYTAAVDQFVATTGALSAATDAMAEAKVLRALDVASALTLALEQQANPVRLRGLEGAPRSETVESASAPSAPLVVAALVAGLSWALPALYVARGQTEAAEARPARLVYALRRRGPPVGVAAACLFGKRRLLRSLAHSPFFMV